MSDIFLSAQNLTLKSERKTIIDKVSFSLSPGKITTLIGPNGAGKTTLIKLLLGTRNPTSGKVIKRRNLKIGYMPQKITLNTLLPLNVVDFLKLINIDIRIIEIALNTFRIEHLMHTQLQHLSGGELQKILLIQATLNKPDVLILDEPTQGVDVLSQKDIYDYIELQARKNNVAVLHVSHDLHLVMAKSDEVLCLNHHLCCSGHPEDVKEHPEYLNLFGHVLSQALAPYHHHHDHKHDE